MVRVDSSGYLFLVLGILLTVLLPCTGATDTDDALAASIVPAVGITALIVGFCVYICRLNCRDLRKEGLSPWRPEAAQRRERAIARQAQITNMLQQSIDSPSSVAPTNSGTGSRSVLMRPPLTAVPTGASGLNVAGNPNMLPQSVPPMITEIVTPPAYETIAKADNLPQQPADVRILEGMDNPLYSPDTPCDRPPSYTESMLQ